MPEIQEGDQETGSGGASMMESGKTGTEREKKREMQRLYKGLLDYQAVVTRRVSRQQRRLAPEVLKMNRREIDVRTFRSEQDRRV